MMISANFELTSLILNFMGKKLCFAKKNFRVLFSPSTYYYLQYGIITKIRGQIRKFFFVKIAIIAPIISYVVTISRAQKEVLFVFFSFSIGPQSS